MSTATLSLAGIKTAKPSDRHFEPLRQRTEQAEARVKELEFGLKHQCETCEMKSIFDGEHAYALKMQARVKELEAENENAAEAYKLLQSDTNALRAANAKLKRDNDRYFDDFRAQQKKLTEHDRELAHTTSALKLNKQLRERAEQANAELAGALRETLESPDSTISGQLYHRMKQVLDRHAAGEPAKHPDTEPVRRFRIGLCQKCGEFLEHGHECDTARKEVQP